MYNIKYDYSILKKTVVFLGTNIDGFEFAGTSFLTAVFLFKHLEINYANLFLVTAKHNLIKFRKLRDGTNFSEEQKPKLFIYLKKKNPHERESIEIHSDEDKWIEHMDNCLDIYVYNLGLLNIDTYQQVTLAKELYFATREIIEKEKIMCGDEIAFCGLYHIIPGKEKNIPLIRFGRLVDLCEDTIKSGFYGDMYLYLIEGLSTGGMSGAPVFIIVPNSQSGLPLKYNGEPYEGPRIYLLGIVHGHDYEIQKESTNKTESTNKNQIHTGITKIVPAQVLSEILSQDKIKDKCFTLSNIIKFELKVDTDNNPIKEVDDYYNQLENIYKDIYKNPDYVKEAMKKARNDYINLTERLKTKKNSLEA